MWLRYAQIGGMISFVPDYLADSKPASCILAFLVETAEDYTGSKASA